MPGSLVHKHTKPPDTTPSLPLLPPLPRLPAPPVVRLCPAAASWSAPWAACCKSKWSYQQSSESAQRTAPRCYQPLRKPAQPQHAWCTMCRCCLCAQAPLQQRQAARNILGKSHAVSRLATSLSCLARAQGAQQAPMAARAGARSRLASYPKPLVSVAMWGPERWVPGPSCGGAACAGRRCRLGAVRRPHLQRQTPCSRPAAGVEQRGVEQR